MLDYLIVQDRVSKSQRFFNKAGDGRAGSKQGGFFFQSKVNNSKVYRRGKYPFTAVNLVATSVTKFNRYEFYADNNFVYIYARKIKETIHSIKDKNHINSISNNLPEIWIPNLNLNQVKLTSNTSI